MNYFLQLLVQSRRQTDNRLQTESDTYEPTMHIAQVGSTKGSSPFQRPILPDEGMICFFISKLICVATWTNLRDVEIR